MGQKDGIRRGITGRRAIARGHGADRRRVWRGRHRQGLSPLEASLMSLLVFAGGSQFVAMDLWTHPASWSALGFAALLVNLRHVLMSASIAGKLDDFRGWRKYAAMLVLTDESWALSEFRVIAGRLTAGFFTGAALSIYIVWNLATSPVLCWVRSWATCRSSGWISPFPRCLSCCS